MFTTIKFTKKKITKEMVKCENDHSVVMFT